MRYIFNKIWKPRGESILNHGNTRISATVLRILFTLCFFANYDDLLAQESVYAYDQSGDIASVLALAVSFPNISVQPQSELVYSNTPVTFSVVASGPGLSFQWLSNNVPIPGAIGDSLVLPNILSTNGSYSVIVSNFTGMVTSAPAYLWSDSNGNGIPDWWEIRYFGNLNQPALGDYDGDGVDNLDEYLEGTNPTNAASFNPRLYLNAVRGQAFASPDQPYYTNGQFVTLTAIPNAGDAFLGWSGGVGGTKSSISFQITAHSTVTANFGLPLGVALNNTNLVWITGGAVPWFGQAEINEDGIGAAQSGLIVDSQQSTFQTAVSLSQTNVLSFWWSVSCQSPDALSFSIDGSTRASIAGQAVPWQQWQTNVPPGNHNFLWTYAKNGGDNTISGIPYSDAAWIGDVSLISSASTAPKLSIAIVAPNSVTLSWPAPSTGYTLQVNSSLSTTNWVNVSNTVNTVGGQEQVNLPLSKTNQFYRLIY